MTPGQALNSLTLTDHVGPVPNALLSAGLAAGVGYGAGHLYESFLAPKKDKSRPMLWAALAGGAAALPAGLGAYNRMTDSQNPSTGLSRAFLNPWPHNAAGREPAAYMKASADTVGPVDYRPMPMSLHTSANSVLTDPTLTPVQRLHGLVILDQASNGRSGFTTMDLIHGAAAAGLGAGVGAIAGLALSKVFGLPSGVQGAAAAAGAVGGVMRQAGIWR